MAADGALSAAKQAALQALIIQTTTPQKDQQRKRRRRKRKRDTESDSTSRQVRKEIENSEIAADISDEEGKSNGLAATEGVEYEPESMAAVLKRARFSIPDDDSNDDAHGHGEQAAEGGGEGVKELMEALSRFERRGQQLEPQHDTQYAVTTEHADANATDKKVAKSRGRHVTFSDHLNTENGYEHSKADRSTAKDYNETAKNNEEEDQADDVENEDDSTKQPSSSRMSRKKWKEERRNLISNLKSIVPDPSVVDSWDITATDPVFLATLKSVQNSVSVPINWHQKRKYLQNKRGLEKRTIPLPSYIAALGLDVTRDAQREADSKKTLKQKQRERMRAKISSTDLALEDERRLRDAFFKFQTKPSLTALGDVYYELRELEVDSKHFVPGVLSNELKLALAMSVKHDVIDAVPWLVGMQRWGPPPGWPGMRVRGVNVPIPDGARWGFGPGEWGKAPVDERGFPIYGDVFEEGLNFERVDRRFDISEKQKLWRWGYVRDVDDEDESSVIVNDGDGEKNDGEEEEEEEEVRKEVSGTGNERGLRDGGRRDRDGVRDENETQKTAYRVLPERRAWAGNSEGVLGSSHVYDMGHSRGAQGRDGDRDRDRNDNDNDNEQQQQRKDREGGDPTQGRNNNNKAFKF